MKTLINAKFESGPEQDLKTPTQRVTINYVEASGFARNIMLTSNCIVIKRLNAQVMIPLDQLVKAAVDIEPLLAEPPAKPAPQPEAVPTTPA